MTSKGKPAVVHCKRETYDVYIGRPMRGFRDEGWGNPFKIERDSVRITSGLDLRKCELTAGALILETSKTLMFSCLAARNNSTFSGEIRPDKCPDILSPPGIRASILVTIFLVLFFPL